jgi:hypothetical protein
MIDAQILIKFIQYAKDSFKFDYCLFHVIVILFYSYQNSHNERIEEFYN